MTTCVWQINVCLFTLLTVLLPVWGGNVKLPLKELFDGPKIEQERWITTEAGDMHEKAVDIVKGRLRFRLDTMETRDDTVKFLGMRTKETIDLSKGLDISVDLDWNRQANGCYLTSGFILCPAATEKNPGTEKSWLKFEYVGVPPGQNARAQLVVKEDGREKYIYTEGWPDKQKTGRKIGLQHIRLVVQAKRIEVYENGKRLFASTDFRLTFPKAYLYLQMSSHSNYRAREVFFDNVLLKVPTVEKPQGAKAPAKKPAAPKK